MHITGIETIAIRVPIKPALAIRSGRGGSHTVSPFLLVKIPTDAGLVGIGEASCTPRWSGEDQVTAAHVINTYFVPLLVGEAVDDVARLYAKFAPTVAGNYFTKAAVEMALWDLAAKAAGVPLWKLLRQQTATFSASRPNWNRPTAAGSAGDSHAPRTAVPTKWSVSGVEPARAAEIAAWAVGQGFRSMKVKVGIDPEGDLARVHAIRRVLGPQKKLGVDANGGWQTPEIAIEMIHRLHAECDIAFAEQPLPAGDHDALAEVLRHAPVPIIADESVYTLADARMLARAQAADVFSIYIGKAGGIGPAQEIAKFAHTVGIRCTIGSNLELGVGTAAMIHLALATPAIDGDAYPCDIIGPLYYEDDVLTEPLSLTGGVARPPEGPGLGIALDDAKIEQYRVG